MALQYASGPLKNYTSIVLPAVQNNHLAIQFASNKNKMDPTIIHAALVNMVNNGHLSISDKNKFLQIYSGYKIKDKMGKMIETMENSGELPTTTYKYDITGIHDNADDLSLEDAQSINNIDVFESPWKNRIQPIYIKKESGPDSHIEFLTRVQPLGSFIPFNNDRSLDNHL